MNTAASLSLLRAAALAALLGSLANAAQARVNWSIGLDLGQPFLTSLPHGAVSVQVGGGHGRYWRHGHHWYRPWHSYGGGVRWVLVAPPVVFPLEQQPAVVAAVPPALPAAPSRPDPVIYPRNGQDAQQTEYDRQECNRWATTQPAALADASVFHRAVEACMDGRGYTMK
jgi:hypothetical protein